MIRTLCLFSVALFTTPLAAAATDGLPALLSLPTLDYPAAAASLGVEGTCSMYVIVSQDGHLETALPQDCPRVFQGPAEQALRAATWEPARVDGQAVTASSRVVLQYQRR